MLKVFKALTLFLGANQAASDFTDGSLFYQPQGSPILDANVSKTLGDDDFYSGSILLDDEWQDAFFALFESRNKDTRRDDPLFIWMRGEPGCSPSEFLFGESGIYH